MFVLGIIFLFVSYKVARYAYQFIKIRLQLAAIPQPPLASFFWGHKSIIEQAKADNTFLELFIKWTAEYGDTILFWSQKRPFVFTSCPEMLHKATTDLTSFTKVKGLPNRALFQQPIVGLDSILSGGGKLWALKRKLMTRWFAKTNMSNLFAVCQPHMQGSQVAYLRNAVGQGNTLELIHVLGVVFTSYIQVFGMRDLFTPDKVADNVATILKHIPNQLGLNMKMLKAKFSGEKAKTVDMVIEMRSRIKEMVFEKLDEIRGLDNPLEELEPWDLLGFLCLANRQESASNSKKETLKEAGLEKQVNQVINDVMTVCLVLDNMVKQIGALFISLKYYPEVKDKLFEELRANPITDFKSLDKLRYTEQCILESLRVAPALLRGTRMFRSKPSKNFGPYNLGSTTVQLFYSQYVLHHSEKYWDEPHVFKPERWTKDFSPAPYSYMPFFVGPRSCIGKHLAMFCMKLTLSEIARNFDMVPKFDEERPPVVDQSMAVMRIRNELNYYFTPVPK